MDDAQCIGGLQFRVAGADFGKSAGSGFYARQNIRTPVKIAVITLVVTQLMNLAFIIPLRHAGLALAIGLGACLNAGLLYYKLRSHQIYQPQPGWAMFMAKISIALTMMRHVSGSPRAAMRRGCSVLLWSVRCGLEAWCRSE